MKLYPEDKIMFVGAAFVLAGILLTFLTGCGPPPAPTPVEAEPDEKPMLSPCSRPLEAGLTVEEVEEVCGRPFSRLYTPQYPDAMALRWCRPGTPCRQFWVAGFWEGRLRVWGRGYEVVQ